ncbi:TetR/AcrR family transcriptional regulator [Congregibacter sp.]|uniref:TetR/AcrR family transcriptional regulator n=1 Tax=Congregibacter sp. TaxID=2744308 RepID=UPI003F6B2774
MSLRLFNDEGEAHVTTIDIAAELDISPGNLYYHFKGKDQIIAELFEQFQLALGQTLAAPVEQPLHEHKGLLEDNWYYLYVVLEELYQYRFFYHNLDDLMRRYPKLVRGFRRIIAQKRAALNAIIASLFEDAETAPGHVQLDALVENMTLQLTYWLNYDRLLHDQSDAQRCIHQGVLQLLTMIAPYLGEDQMDFYRECEVIFDGMLTATQQ